MASTAIREVTASEFSMLLKGERPMLADFSSIWCGPCKAMLPIVERLAANFAGRAEFVKVDVDQFSKLAATHGVRGVPTFLLFANGQAVERVVGLTSENALAALIEQHIVPTMNKSEPLVAA